MNDNSFLSPPIVRVPRKAPIVPQRCPSVLFVASALLVLPMACGDFPHGPHVDELTTSTTADSLGSTPLLPQSTNPTGATGSSEGGTDDTSNTDDTAPCEPWTRPLGTPEEDVGKGIAVDAEGNIYVTGYTKGNLDEHLSAGSTDIFLAKYDPHGTKLWTKQLGGDEGAGIAIDSSGYVYITGHTGGSLHGNANKGTTDAFLVKYAPNGERQWTEQLGTLGVDLGYAVAVGASELIYVVGSTQGQLGEDPFMGNGDVFVTTYQADRMKLGTRQFGTKTWDDTQGVAIDNQGNMYLTGNTLGKLDVNVPGSSWDLFTAKIGADGNTQWIQQFGTSGGDHSLGMALHASTGHIYISGFTGGSLGGNSAGGNDGIVLKYDLEGNRLWERQFGSDLDDHSTGIAVDSSEQIYVTGYTEGSLVDKPPNGAKDIFVVNYTAEGKKQWTQQFGTPLNDEGTSIAVDASGRIYITGYMNGSLESDTTTNNSDIFVMHVCSES